MRKTSVNPRATWQVAASALALVLGAGLAAPANALVVRDDVGVDESVDTDNEWAGVGHMWNRVLNPDNTVSTFVCTGSLINARTVILAQHCTVGVPDSGYGPGEGNHMGFSFDPTDTFTGFDDWRRDGLGNIQNPITGVWESLPDQQFYNVLQVQTPFSTGEAFPGGDILMATLDTPAIGLTTYGMLFSPLSGPTHADLVAYGSNGTGSTGPTGGIDNQRRIGENMIDGLFSQADFLAATFLSPGFDYGVEGSQLLYHIDMDNPIRNEADCHRGAVYISANDLTCDTGPWGPAITADGTSAIEVNDQIDWYDGDALPNEAGTAGGDSGSALFADTIYSRPLIAGVLSGGWNFTSPNGGYGDVSYFNPLFLFRDWLVANNPYVYASARNGNRNWSNASHWVQNMDPNYFYIDKHGRVRNGLPAGPEPGYFADDPKWGTVFDTDVPGEAEGATGAPGAVTPDRGGSATTGHTASNGAPTGPGSTGFVPNNSYGTYGTWDGSEDGTARFYDVTLNNIGKTTLDINVEIDNLTVSGLLSVLDVRAGRNLNSLVAVDQFRGFVNVDGTVRTREYMLWGGFLTGDGTINASTLYNVDGNFSPGDLDSVGSMTINGNYVQTNHGNYIINIRRQGNTVTNDFVLVNGAASLDGDAIVLPVNVSSRPRYQDVYTVLHGNSVIGNFDDVDLVLGGPALYGESVVQADGDVEIRVKARRLGNYYSVGHSLHSLAAALDDLRFGGNYNNLAGVFDLVDSASFANFESAMVTLTPTNSFQTVPLAVQYTQGFTLGLEARTAELRQGVVGMSPRSALTGMRIAQAGVQDDGDANTAALSSASMRPMDLGDRLGVFISGQGNLSAVGDEAIEGDRFNPTHMSAFSQADLTVGADYRVDDGFAIGVATTMSRYLARDANSGAVPMDHSGYGAMVYSSAWEGSWFLDSYLGVARHEYTIARLPGMGMGDDAEASPGAVQTMVGARAGYNFSPLQGLSLGPSLAVNYSNLAMDGYTEQGGEDFALNVEARSLRSVTAETALQFSYRPSNDGVASPFAAYGRVGYVTELGDGVDMVRARFVVAPVAAFDVARELDREWISASTGFSYQVDENMSANLEATSDMGREELSSTMIRAGFNWQF